MRVAPCELPGQSLAVGVDQELVRIEAVAGPGLIGPMDAVAVELAGRDLGKIDVPHVVGALGHGDALRFTFAVAVEQAQLDLGGMGGKQREIRPPTRSEEHTSELQS